jgi:hypothetical protein
MDCWRGQSSARRCLRGNDDRPSLIPESSERGWFDQAAAYAQTAGFDFILGCKLLRETMQPCARERQPKLGTFQHLVWTERAKLLS